MIKTIFITGASSGLGRALAIAYAAKGITLILTGRNQKRLQETKKSCQEKGAKVIHKAVDLLDIEFSNWLDKILEKHLIDIVFANAGISAGTSSGHESTKQINHIFDVNVQGVLNSINPIIPQMVQRKAGQIAIIGSIAGVRPLPSCPAYSASKASIMAYGDALRGDLMKENVFVSVVIPGYIKTPMTAVNDFPMPFMLEADEAAELIKKRLAKAPKRIAFPFLLYFLSYFANIISPIFTDYFFSKLPGKKNF